jgi:hypothetical protein
VGALAEMLAAADTPEPNALAVETAAGVMVHPLPLPEGLTPEAWLARLPLAPEVRSSARWTLGVARGRATTVEPTQEWAPVPGG